MVQRKPTRQIELQKCGNMAELVLSQFQILGIDVDLFAAAGLSFYQISHEKGRNSLEWSRSSLKSRLCIRGKLHKIIQNSCHTLPSKNAHLHPRQLYTLYASLRPTRLHSPQTSPG